MLNEPPSQRSALGLSVKSMLGRVVRADDAVPADPERPEPLDPVAADVEEARPPRGRAATCGRRRRGSRSASASRRSTCGPSPWIASTNSATPRARQSSPSASRSLRNPEANSTWLIVSTRVVPSIAAARSSTQTRPSRLGTSRRLDAPARQVHPGVDVRRVLLGRRDDAVARRARGTPRRPGRCPGSCC